ncbi:non-ribosomal peptide synthetase [Actinomadura chibensis]|uniref:Phenyloxazoline synthase MbtB n=2 Tax=Actinomadura chibensis TaxID=392828 RepID=A0A5D0NU63_9ACTN|nr:non-ribosomal peptide synthetase [Actinomadura chibensis]
MPVLCAMTETAMRSYCLSAHGRVLSPNDLEAAVNELTGSPCRAIQTVPDGSLTALVESVPGAGPSARRVRGAALDACGAVVETVAFVDPGSLTGDRADLVTRYRRGLLPVRAVDTLAAPPVPLSAASDADRPGSRARAAAPSAPAPALDEIARAAADLLGVRPEDLDHGEDLIALGLDSVRVMQLANDWLRRGLDVKFTDLVEAPTIESWHALLRSCGAVALPRPEAEPVDRDAPFALTPLQHAYWFGRRDRQVLGGVGCHFYIEFDGTAIDRDALERAARALFERHDLLRARFLDDGTQQVLPHSPWPGLTVHDLSTAEDAEEALLRKRELLSHRRLDVERGEVLDLALSLLPGGAYRLHVNIDLLVADVRSIQIVLQDLAALYRGEDAELPPLTYSFREYLAQREPLRAKDREAGRRYWADRLAELPPGPPLPLAVEPERVERVRVVRRDRKLTAGERERLAGRARAHGVTLPMAMAAALAEVVGLWSGAPRFVLNVPLFDRQAIHPDVEHMVADFSNLVLLEVDLSRPQTFAERVAALQARFQRDAAHSAYSGVEVLRDLNRGGRHDQVTAPVVFTSALGMGDLVGADVRRSLGRLGSMLSQTPQVWLDHQVVEVDGGLLVNWDAVEELFPPGVLDGMADGHNRLLDWLLENDWDAPVPTLVPPAQLAVRATVNDTAAPLPEGTLHERFFELARRDPSRPAVHHAAGPAISYGDLAGRALRVAGFLQRNGVRPGDAVAVCLPKGPGQVAAVLGVLAAGAMYVPVGVDQPPARRDQIVRTAGARFTLTLAPDELPDVPPLDAPVAVDPESSAYVIFTSGSTGAPKGVEVAHRAALNTVLDVDARFGVTGGDRVLAVSALDFDLSVWDVFGPLSAGASLVMIDEAERRDAARWARLVNEHRVTVWNTVPALLDMLLTAADGPLPSLRLALVSGDWVPLDLSARLAHAAPRCRLIALGGATEAAIWSNYCPVPPRIPSEWVSVPYGRPLTNQCFRVVDPQGRDCPDWGRGELWIGGAGVAKGYRGDPDTTAAKFVEHDGVRWYRTGDMGRYWPDGTLEFLGRIDHQVKVRGHRIELGEVEAALLSHPGVERATATTVESAAHQLAAVVVPSGDQQRLDEDDLRAHLADRLPPYMVPEHIAQISGLPLTANGKVDRAEVRTILTGELAGRAERFEPPRPGIESVMAAIWTEVLKVPAVGRDQNFFALGGDSLLATRLILRLRAEGVAGAELTNLFDNPELAAFARTVRLGGEDEAAEASVLRADPEHRYEPFPPTDVQRAYWFGRTDAFALGGVGCHFYTEYDFDGLDLARFGAAWNRLIERHEMLRAVFQPDGAQRILPTAPELVIPVTEAGDGAADEALAELRGSMSHQLIDVTRWPLFDVRAVRYGEGRVRIGVSFDNIVFDALSIMTLLRELDVLYRDPGADLPPTGPSFRDYVLTVGPDPQARRDAEEYWSARVGELPPAPQLPLAADPAGLGRPRFTRRQIRVPAEQWRTVKDTARRHGLTLSTVLATAFADALGAWSARRDMTINLTLFDRRQVHPDIDRVLGDFTSLLLVAYEPGDTWLDSARRLQRRVARDLDHSDVSALWVMRELARRTGSSDAAMPVVFTSTLGVADEDGALTGTLFADPVWGVSQTPQVWIDHQVVEVDGGLVVNWDAVEDLFPPGVLDAMTDGYGRLLEWLLDSDWDAPAPSLVPASQLAVRAAANDTAAPVPEGTLHGRFFERARRDPSRVAIRPGVSYGELAGRALRVAGFLRERGVRAGDAVAVSLPKGPDQIAAVLGVLAAGALYVPIGVDQPKARREQIMRRADARLLLTEPPEGEPLDAPVEVKPDASAYVIFTSGSTGEPKGVEVSHRAALNTVLDVNARFGVGADDRVLAVSALDFDLSVWDVFGPLSAGGSLVMVDEDDRRDAARWARLVAEHGVTVWNTVPALLDMLLVAERGQLGSLRLAMVSGDWVPLDMSARLARVAPECRLIALGGATEAAIWSNYCPVPAEVPPEWVSVPYGRPLANQCFRVVDSLGRDCPDWTPGELWIGGAGVAEGYRGDPDTTRAKFVEHEGMRWYRTGDMGRYWPDGTLEFLGRVDHQVKVRGHRIELGEIEAALLSHPGVKRAVATTVGGAARGLAALVVPAGDLDGGDLRDWLAGRLPPYMIPEPVVQVPDLPLTPNGKIDRNALNRLVEEHGDGPPEDAPPTGPVEEALAGIWRALLDVPDVGRHQNFVTLGGDSVLATRLAEEIRIEFGVELPLRALFAEPTIAGHAALIERRDDDGAFDDGAFEEGTI